MRRRYWRYSRPVRCALYVCLLLVLAWFLRLANGPSPAGAEKMLRRVEKQSLRRPGELVELLEGGVYNNAVTWEDGEIYDYVLTAVTKNGKITNRYSSGFAYRDTKWGNTAWCTTCSMEEYSLADGKSVLNRRFHVLIKAPDAAVRSGVLTVACEVEEYRRTWRSTAERENPYYLSFPVELKEGGDRSYQMYHAMNSGLYYDSPVTARAEAVFYDEEGNEVSRLTFDMVEGPSGLSLDLPEINVVSENGEGSAEHGA